MKASDGWWSGLVNQQQHTAAVCLSLPGPAGPSILHDLWFSASQMLLAHSFILEPMFTLAAAVTAEGALNWAAVVMVAEWLDTSHTPLWRSQGPSELR